ncbi:MAG: hypothetical protein V3U92_02035 [Cellulophaga sp.]
MGIQASCYLREITKADQNLLKKAGAIFRLNTTPSVLMRVLKEYFINQKTIDTQTKKIEKLTGQLIEAQQELGEFKKEVGAMFKAEKELNIKRDKILKSL